MRARCPLDARRDSTADPTPVATLDPHSGPPLPRASARRRRVDGRDSPARIEESLMELRVRGGMSTDDGSGPVGAEPDADAEAGGDADAAVHPNAAQHVVTVDADDTPTGTTNRLEAHLGDGVRHRAFTSLVFDDEGRILLAQRSPDKRLWDTYWDGTVASHPVEGQSQREATRERLEEELGVTPDQYDEVRLTDKFEYKRYYENRGLEWEVCSVLKVDLDDTSLDPDTSEVAGLLWADYEHLHEHPEWYRQLRLCPWFEIAMRRDFERREAE